MQAFHFLNMNLRLPLNINIYTLDIYIRPPTSEPATPHTHTTAAVVRQQKTTHTQKLGAPVRWTPLETDLLLVFIATVVKIIIATVGT